MFLPKMSHLPSTLKPLELNVISKVVKLKPIYAWDALTEKRTCYMLSLYYSGAGEILGTLEDLTHDRTANYSLLLSSNTFLRTASLLHKWPFKHP